MKIKSESDVITNSSNEVFCFKMDEEYEELKKEVPEFVFTEFKTLDDIRKYVTDENYQEWDFTLWAQCEHGEGAVKPKHDFYGGYENREFIEALKNSGKPMMRSGISLKLVMKISWDSHIMSSGKDHLDHLGLKNMIIGLGRRSLRR